MLHPTPTFLRYQILEIPYPPPLPPPTHTPQLTLHQTSPPSRTGYGHLWAYKVLHDNLGLGDVGRDALVRENAATVAVNLVLFVLRMRNRVSCGGM